ncbi:MAG: SH3 domain-containing protein [Acidobacteriota bacterium]
MKIKFLFSTAAMLALFVASVSSSTSLSTRQSKPANPPTEACDIDAYMIEDDPNGLNVRSGPGKDYPVIAVLPKKEEPNLIHISGASGAWVRIAMAETLEGEPLFNGTGYVFASKLATSIRPDGAGGYQARIFQQANLKSKVVTRIPAESEVLIIGCAGKWAQVQSKSIKGWLSPNGQCPNPVTTCP